ncbi:hypothetical protein Mpt1_c12980 [Candidatus Methanoplasma termitum]|uniref:Uncharacterized protein n=1 Tax=Candidatus Methanoplasma termitum TaxID=1577791 RepID=A0A0A7LDD3_9ARCH|nr:hypothetical protein Mpt1_c12980 [Candidatus Methanoplasma termitum]
MLNSKAAYEIVTSMIPATNDTFTVSNIGLFNLAWFFSQLLTNRSGPRNVNNPNKNKEKESTRYTRENQSPVSKGKR